MNHIYIKMQMIYLKLSMPSIEIKIPFELNVFQVEFVGYKKAKYWTIMVIFEQVRENMYAWP